MTRLELPDVDQLVDGVWSSPTDELDLVLEDPFLGTPIGTAVASCADAVDAAVTAADAAFTDTAPGAWVGLAAAARADVLDAVATELESAVGRLAGLEAFATGVPVTQTSIVGVIVPGAFRLAAQMLRDGILLEDPGRTQRSGRRGAPVAPRSGGLPGAVERSGTNGGPQGGQRAGSRSPHHPQAQ